MSAVAPAFAHEILIVPTESDGKVTAPIKSTRVVAVPEDLEAAVNIEASLVTPGGTETLVVAQGGDLSLMTEAEAPKGAAWLVAHHLPLIHSNTPEG